MPKKFLLLLFLLLDFQGYLYSQYFIKSCMHPVSSSKAKDIISFNAGMPFYIEDIKGDTLLIPDFPYKDIHKKGKSVDSNELGNNVGLWIDTPSGNLSVYNSLNEYINIFLADLSGKVFFQTKVNPGSASIKISHWSNQCVVVGCEYQSIIIKTQKFLIR